MYDITKTRMLLTTSVIAAVAALCASGANARIPDQDSPHFEGHLSIVGVVSAQVPSWRGKGGKGEETGGATNPLQQTRVSRSTYIDGWLAGLLARAAGATTALQQIGVTRSGSAAELTRPCSLQGSKARCRGGIALP